MEEIMSEENGFEYFLYLITVGIMRRCKNEEKELAIFL